MWFVGGEGVTLDQLTNRVTAFNIFDTISVSQLPSRLLRLACVACYEFGETPVVFHERVRLEQPDGHVAPKGESATIVSVQPIGPIRVHRSLHVLWSIDLVSLGVHRLKLETSADGITWETRADHRLDVNEQSHPLLNQKVPG